MRKLAQWLMWAGVLSMISACSSMTDRQKCILASATVGGLAAGGIGTGVALSKKNQKGYLEWVVPVSVA
ncbi:MAG TPA: hypothetical protein VEF07_05535, partial [Candidatus Binataceae bacterium]|nr:hypothetical protein [Candidatus Binataceae bacterium]